MPERDRCDVCGGPKPASGWRLLELWEALARDKASLTNTKTWQLCVRCASRLKKRGLR